MIHHEGQITDILPLAEPKSAYQSLFITYKDGRFLKLRLPYVKIVNFNLKTPSIISCTDEGVILSVSEKTRRRKSSTPPKSRGPNR